MDPSLFIFGDNFGNDSIFSLVKTSSIAGSLRFFHIVSNSSLNVLFELILKYLRSYEALNFLRFGNLSPESRQQSRRYQNIF